MALPSRSIGFAMFCGALLACHSAPSAPPKSRSAELLEVRAPESVTPGSSFSVTGYFGRGACDEARPMVEQSMSGARLGLQLATKELPPGTACIMILLADSVTVNVVAPYTLPYTVRLVRYMKPDSVVVITSR